MKYTVTFTDSSGKPLSIEVKGVRNQTHGIKMAKYQLPKDKYYQFKSIEKLVEWE
jgi:hypothetical protein